MKQAQEMQKKLAEAQEKYIGKEFLGVAGGGKVHVTVEVIKIGSYKAKKVDIDLEFMRNEEKEMVEDLIVAAFNDAIKKAEEDMTNATSDLAGMMGLPPGFKLPF
ncbi:YbaB/EbfC family nucleoid-associated protein [Wolbachia endosymbiont (group E) of Neria commutata]|uniref:YbaB/EbfC family nucleoid-associated protein n=1 Tax=Wolbachia endosymbiont (group E) of Neria commutata TaxID=3066149 RepID=UPI003132ED9E